MKHLIISRFQLEISIKQKLNEVISQGSSGSVVKDACVRTLVRFFFPDISCKPFLPYGDCSIRVSQSHDFTFPIKELLR